MDLFISKKQNIKKYSFCLYKNEPCIILKYNKKNIYVLYLFRPEEVVININCKDMNFYYNISDFEAYTFIRNKREHIKSINKHSKLTSYQIFQMRLIQTVSDKTQNLKNTKKILKSLWNESKINDKYILNNIDTQKLCNNRFIYQIIVNKLSYCHNFYLSHNIFSDKYCILINLDKFDLNEIVFVKYNRNGYFSRGKIINIKPYNCYDILMDTKVTELNIPTYCIRKSINGKISKNPKLEYIKIDKIKVDQLIHIKYTDIVLQIQKEKNVNYIPQIILKKGMIINDNNNSILMNLNSLLYITYAKINKKKNISYTIKKNRYKLKLLDENSAIQTNLFSKTDRDIIISDFDEKILDDISTLDTNTFEQINYNKLPKKYQNHISNLQNINHMRIYKTEQILQQNIILNSIKEQYNKKGYNPDMKIVSHGCSSIAINSILNNKQGFQLLNPINGSLYGNGVYFSSNINISKLYSIPNIYDRYYILICEMMLGKYKKTDTFFTTFDNDEFRTGGNLEEYIYMKPWGYINDINIAYVIEFNL
jgi:hypothetical protein